ncbi:response regulator transcription factor [Dyella soli]|uniref:Response regulator transcription factor n=3 Tax=Dyella TaxID=231454 RepID=A0A4R0YYQ4_9GAMM|nr:response regulator transcription factor [Dyella soli]
MDSSCQIAGLADVRQSHSAGLFVMKCLEDAISKVSDAAGRDAVQASQGLEAPDQAYDKADPGTVPAYGSRSATSTHGPLHAREEALQIRVIVADDHPVVLAGIQAVLERSPDIKVVGEAHNGDQLLDMLSRTSCDVIITDFSMPGSRHGDGLPLLSVLASRYSGIPVIVHTMVYNVGVLRTVLDQGVLGLADKRSTMSDLVMAVRAVVARRRFISASLLRKFEQSEMVVNSDQVSPPSPREMEVFRLYVGGLSVSQIAERLNRSVKTVSTQKRQAMRKLGLVHDRDMVAYAREHGII